MAVALDTFKTFQTLAYVGGVWTDADDGATDAVTNPSTGEEIGRIPRCGAAETERAVAAATAAFGGWRRKTAAERGLLLRRLAELIESARLPRITRRQES